MVGIVGQSEKSLTLIEPFCGLVDGINLHGPNPDLRSEIFRPTECVDQQELSQFLSLYGPINSQSSDQHDGHFDPRQILLLICGQGFKAHSVIGKGVVSFDQSATDLNQHVGPGQILLLELTHFC